MADVSATIPVASSDHDNYSVGSPIYSHRSGSSITSMEPMPVPDFTFPARLADDEHVASASRRPMSAQMSKPMHAPSRSINQRRSASVLPNFSFNPSASSSASNSSPATPPHSPPHSPTLPLPTTPSRHIGHRRGGSEFIGGDGKGGGIGLMSTSPTKGDGILPPPSSSSRLGLPNGRRGHVHRRSGAISCHDLQTILQPTDANAQPRGGSAPVTPLENEDKIFFAPQSRRSISQSDLRMPSAVERTGSADDLESSPRKVVPRVRVGFSERVEYIRPLSTISSETESSLSTIRGHSVNNSLSSVLSAGAASPSSVKMGRPSLQTTFEDENPCGRPSTANDVLEAMSLTKDDFGGSLNLPERPNSAAATESPTATTPPCGSPVKTKTNPKKRLSGWFDHRRHSKPLSPSFPASHSEPSLVVTPPDTPGIPQEAGLEEDTVNERAMALKIDGDRKPRKVRSWAHSIISLRHKPKTPTEEAPSPFDQLHDSNMPPIPNTRGLDFSLVADFDEDNTVDIVTSSVQSTTPQYDSRFGAGSPPSEGSFSSESMSPIIDLDAALGPFNTPTGSRSPNPRPTFSRRSMHSGSFGNSLQSFPPQHRRTESAPELAPFDARMKMSSSSTMADVFEEDEEDEYDGRKPVKSAMRKSKPLETFDDSGLGVQIIEFTDRAQASSDAWTFDSGLGISNSHGESEEAAGSLDVEPAILTPEDAPIGEPGPESITLIRGSSPVEVVEDYEEPRASSLTKDSDSTITPTLSEDESKQPPPLMKINLSMAPPSIMTPDTLSSSPLSTPDYPRGSELSFETPRLGTAASSIADSRTVNSFILGEPGPEYRMSVDDVPSLTSSRSTMTSPPQYGMAHQMHGMHDTRSISVSSIPSAGVERTRKRASIGSLSRLMGGSFGERSKLSIESRPQSEHRSSQGAESKRKKRHRISRLMTFWKSKEQLTS